MFDCLDAIPTRWHAHVDECHGIGKSGELRRANLLEGFDSLVGRIHFEANAGRLGRLTEEECLVGIQIGCDHGRRENLAKVRVDALHIVNLQDTQVLRCTHNDLSAGFTGSSSVKAAPWPSPSLWAV